MKMIMVTIDNPFDFAILCLVIEIIKKGFSHSLFVVEDEKILADSHQNKLL